MSINAPGIYADSYAASGTPQSIPTPDGSYFQYEPASVYAPIVSYYDYNAPGSGNDGFGLISPLLPHTGPGTQLLYNPGTQSAVIPVDFSDFNPGKYQWVELMFDTALTVNLTVVPEPSTLSLFALSGLGALLHFRRRNKHFKPALCQRKRSRMQRNSPSHQADK